MQVSRQDARKDSEKPETVYSEILTSDLRPPTSDLPARHSFMRRRVISDLCLSLVTIYCF